MKRRTWIGLTVCVGIVLAGSLLFVASSEAAGPAKTLKIGSLLSTTGWHTIIDAIDERNTKLMAQMINDKGGIKVKGERYNIELVIEDTKSTMEGVSAAATRLAFDKKVKFVIGPNSFWSPGATPVFTPNKILNVAGFCAASPGELDANTPYAFVSNNGSVGNVMVAIRAMKTEFPTVKKVVFVCPDDGAMPYLVPKLKKILEQNGYAILEAVGLPNEIVDFSPIAVKLNAIKDADAIVHINGAPQAIGNNIKALRELGNTKPYITTMDGDGNDLLALIGKAATNVVCIGVQPNHPDNPPVIKELWEKAERKPPLFVFQANALYMLAKVIEAANSLDPTVVKKKWESMDKIDTIYGQGIVCGDQTYGIKHHAVSHPFSYSKIMDGKVTFGKWAPTPAIP
jgi:branched-chain amino acid transport system substrate-binding protein